MSSRQILPGTKEYDDLVAGFVNGKISVEDFCEVQPSLSAYRQCKLPWYEALIVGAFVLVVIIPYCLITKTGLKK